MKAKTIKDLLNKIPDNADVLFEYSYFIFGGEMTVIEKSNLKDYYDEDFIEEIEEDEDIDSCDFLISFENI